MTDFDQRLTRRCFLTTTGALAASMLAAGCATTAVYHLPLKNGRLEVNPQDHPELARSGGIIQLRTGALDDAILLIHRDGHYTALSANCTHLRCTVRPGKNIIQCPCHGSTFDLDGQVIRGPAERPLISYPIQTVQNTLHITVHTP